MTTKTRIVRIQATRRPRAGWADAARAMSAAGHDDLLDEPSATHPALGRPVLRGGHIAPGQVRQRASGIVAIAVGLLAVAASTEAQPGGKVSTIGVLSSLSRGTPPGTLALVDGLRELGHVEGRNLAIEWRGAGGQVSRFPALAAELVRLNVDVIVATVPPAIEAAQAATKTIPIVMVTPSDPIGAGFVRSFARPGGNVTGLTWQTREAVPKRLQLLKETVPALARVAVLWDPTEPDRRRQVEEAQDAAPKVGVQLQILEVRSLGELDNVFAVMARDRVGAVLIEASSLLAANRSRVADLAVKHRLPTMGWFDGMVDAGILMSYNPSITEQYRRAAYFVDRILKGVKPAELPVEQPTKFDLTINLRTAKALGLTIPPSVLLRADRVVE
jgi:putative ABC transport system substrate-binding protein